MTIRNSISRLLPGVLLIGVAALAAPAFADEPQPWEAGIGIGFIDPEGKRNIDSDPAALLTFGHRYNSTWGAEVAAMLGNDISLIGLRGLYHFSPLPGMWTPFVSLGAGITDPDPGSSDPTGLIGIGVKRPINDNLGMRAELNAHQGFDSGATDVSVFVGLTWSWGAAPAPVAAQVSEPPPPVDSDGDGVPDDRDSCPGTPAGAKVDARGCELDSDGDGVVDSKDNCPGTAAGVKVDALGCELDSDSDGVVDSRDACADTAAGVKVDSRGCELDSDGDGVVDSKDNCPGTAAGVKVDSRGCELDSDGDGVVDSRDACPGTPAGAKVDARGCELDSDGDGVVDSRDACPGTAAGVKVDSRGCELDSDGDGVVDSKDNCPGTAAGVKVDSRGCELDSDGDGVVDSRDACPGTPAGAKVDARGCELDSDGDGVVDSRDECPGTSAGAKVEANGCAAKLLEKVGITLKLNFDTNKADIKPEFSDEIRRVADFMRQYPGTSVVIEGHTDNTGQSEYNRTLSQRRAEAVANSLVSDHGIASNRVSAVGYGDARPIADNGTAEGRAQNRRVEAAIEETVSR